MNKKEILDKIKSLDSLDNNEKAYLVNLVNTTKKYGLVWENKPEDVEEDLRTKLPVLKEIKERAIINDTETEKHPNHILIEGDNLHALTALTFTHENKIDIIYIDPPYNTGNKDFIYNDTYIDIEDDYRHSKWLSFMDKRLRIAKRLLKSSGVIFMSIDDNELAQLKILCDEIFGYKNCENIFTIKVRHENRILRSDIRYHQTTEYLLAYRISDNYIPPRRKNERKTNDDYKYDIKILKSPLKTEIISGYEVEIYNSDSYEIIEVEPSKGQLKSYSIRGSLITQSGSASEFYETNLRSRKALDGLGALYKVINMGKRGDGLGYRYIIQPSSKKIKNGTYFQGKPIVKKEKTLPYPNFYDFVNEFNNVGYEGGIEFKNGKKPLDFLSKVFELSNINNDSVILDFFAGSGSLLHAVMQNNKINNKSNQAIIVTNNENNIAFDVTYKRNKQVIEGYKNNNDELVQGLNNNNLRYYKSNYADRKPSLKNKIELTQLATELLCIKENCYNEVTAQLLNAKWHKLFTNGNNNFVYVIYDDFYIEEAIEALTAFIGKNENINIKVYVFSNGQYAFAEEFENIAANITLAALPDAIYKAYQNVLPKENKELTPQLDDDLNPETAS